MDEEFLKRVIRRPAVRRALLEEILGGYSLGVARDPDGGRDPVILLQVEGEHTRERRVLDVDGKKVEVVIEGGRAPVRPLKGA